MPHGVDVGHRRTLLRLRGSTRSDGRVAYPRATADAPSEAVSRWSWAARGTLLGRERRRLPEAVCGGGLSGLRICAGRAPGGCLARTALCVPCVGGGRLLLSCGALRRMPGRVLSDIRHLRGALLECAYASADDLRCGARLGARR